MIDVCFLFQPNYALCYWYAPLLMNAFISLLITYVFLNTFGMSVDTLFLCFNEDVEQNDGTDENPYYMNSRLAVRNSIFVALFFS